MNPNPTDDAPKHRRKGARNKPFAIERRYIAEPGISFLHRYREWRTYRAYETERDRDNALRTLLAKSTMIRWEYRKATP